MNKTILSSAECLERSKVVAVGIEKEFNGTRVAASDHGIKLYGVPRGGVPAAYLVASHGLYGVFTVVDDPTEADVFIDDLIDSGATRERYRKGYPLIPFYALYDKREGQVDCEHGWLVFPWEHAENAGFEDNIRRILQAVDPNPDREGIADTPKRVAKAWEQWASGYDKDPAEILKVFDDGAKGYNEFVLVRDIPVYSKCEHHLADIFGTADVAYVPNGKIVGLSKLSRLVDMYARRLQVQERLTVEIAAALNEHLSPHGVAVRLRCRHMCMESRGICQQGHSTVTLATHGTLSSGPLRAEFLATGL